MLVKQSSLYRNHLFFSRVPEFRSQCQASIYLCLSTLEVHCPNPPEAAWIHPSGDVSVHGAETQQWDTRHDAASQSYVIHTDCSCVSVCRAFLGEKCWNEVHSKHACEIHLCSSGLLTDTIISQRNAKRHLGAVLQLEKIRTGLLIVVGRQENHFTNLTHIE